MDVTARVPILVTAVLIFAGIFFSGCTTPSPPAPGTPSPVVTAFHSMGQTSVPAGTVPATSVTITAYPWNYSPPMESTPGIRLGVNSTGFPPSGATFSWAASYGSFLSWGAPDYMIHDLGNPVTRNGEPLYWSFVNRTPTPSIPVVISVVATDPGSGDVLGSSQLDLAWDGDYAVTVQDR
jgi:hypothetical protein